MTAPTIHRSHRMGEVIESIESRRGPAYAHLAAQIVGASVMRLELHSAMHNGLPQPVLCAMVEAIGRNLDSALHTAGVEEGDVASLVQAYRADRDDLVQQMRAASASPDNTPQPCPTPPPPQEASDGEGSTPD